MATFQSIARRIRRKVFSKDVFRLAVLLLIVFVGLPFLYVNRASHAEDMKTSGNHPYSKKTLDDPTIDWTKLAYVEYATSPTDLCKAVMLFSELHEASSKGLRVLLYPSDWSIDAKKPEGESSEASIARMLRQAVDEFRVVLKPTDTLRQGLSQWAEDHVRFLGYNLTQFDRVITFGFETIVAHSMDELFLMPPTPLALPYVYWNHSTGWAFSDQVMVIQPDTTSFQAIEAALTSLPADNSIPSIASTLFTKSIIRIPQRPYHLLTQEFTFKDRDHANYLGTSNEKWDPRKVLLQARLVHFFDPPLPGPWTISNTTVQEHLPGCQPTAYRRQDCSTRNAWGKFYSDYQNRRMNVCGMWYE